MRRSLGLLLVLIASLLCLLALFSAFFRLVLPLTLSATATAPPTVTQVFTPTPWPTSTHTPTVTPTPWPTVTPTQTVTPTPPGPEFRVEFHPDGPLYSGDQVSLSVLAPPGLPLASAVLDVQVGPPADLALGSFGFSQWGIDGRGQATSIWAWDTTGLPAGEYTLDFSVAPQGYTFTETITLLPASALPPAQQGAAWAVATSQCCVVNYITGTAAERDLADLTALLDTQAAHAIQAMGVEFTEPLTITIMPRLLGHGGFASDEIWVSYLDRNYAANAWFMVTHHEMIHILDARLGGDLRPSILVEGLAVYKSGGHYKPEEILPRAAALLEEHLNLYIPLAVLAEDFYSAQHEIGYIEAGALVQYLVETYGWEAYSNFYRDIHPVEGKGQAAALEAGLQAHFGLTLAQTEEAFRAFLRQQTGVEAWERDVHLTVSYFDTLRAYQQLLDPSAYFRTAWLLDGPSMRQRGIVADLLRHPSQPANLTLEALFTTAGERWKDGDIQGAEAALGSINQVLAAVERGQGEPFAVQPLAADYLAIAEVLQAGGYELQEIELSGDTANVLVTAQDMNLIRLTLTRLAGAWQVNQE